MKPLLSIFFICAAMLAFSDAWHQPTAVGRIRFEADKRSRSLLVPVPEEFASTTIAIDAVAADGTRLAASPVIVNGKCLAAAVNTGKKEGLAFVYLLPAAPKEPMPFQGPPVHILRTTRELTTRAHTATEMLDMFANLHLIPYPQSLKKPHPPSYAHRNLLAFGEFGKNTAWATVPPPEKGHSFNRAFTCSNAAFAVSTPCTASFAADQTQVAWTILLDGTPVANWTKEGAPLPPSVHLSAGLHAVQILAVQSVSEPIPKPVITIDGKPLTAFLPTICPKTIGFDFSNASPKPTQATLSSEGCYSFHRPEGLLRIYKAAPAEGTLVDVIDEYGAVLPRIGELIAANGVALPSLRFHDNDKTATLRGLRLWEPPTSYQFSFTVHTPPIHDASKPLPLTIHLKLPPHLPAILRDNLSIHCIQTRGENAKSQATIIPLTNPTAIQSLQLPIEQNMNEISLELRGTTALACPPMTIALISAGIAETPLDAQGEQLYIKGTTTPSPAMFVWCQDGNYTAKEHATNAPALFDDGLLTRNAPNATLLPTNLQHIAPTIPSGTAQSLAMLANLHRLLAAKPSKAYIVTTPQTALRDTIALTFICESCLANGIAPVLVTLPNISGNTLFANAESAALKLKSLALQLKIDCLDLYTRALLDNVSTEGWDVSGSIRLNTLNDTARRWIYSYFK